LREAVKAARVAAKVAAEAPAQEERVKIGKRARVEEPNACAKG
jgi:hypothetical protein